MIQEAHIQLIHGQNIDRQKWDACIDNAVNGLIYPYSFYLDTMAKHWDALVLNDYEAVMPLTWNRKFGIHYLYQPFLCAQLGLFGKTIEPGLLESFLKNIPSKYRYWDIYLNYKNIFTLNTYKLYQRNNYVLDLETTYEELYKNYSDNIKRNIQKCKQLGCTVLINFKAEKVIDLAREQMKNFSDIKQDDFERSLQLYEFLYQRDLAITYGILSPQNELLASCIFFFSHNRAYYILVGNHHSGKTMGASHALIDAFIQDHSGKKLILDFEGSDIPNLAFFYSSFGAMEEKYAAIRLNRLPFYLSWIKK